MSPFATVSVPSGGICLALFRLAFVLEAAKQMPSALYATSLPELEHTSTLSNLLGYS